MRYTKNCAIFWPTLYYTLYKLIKYEPIFKFFTVKINKKNLMKLTKNFTVRQVCQNIYYCVLQKQH